MVLMAQVRTCEFCGHGKKKSFPQPPRHRSHRSVPLASISEKSILLFLWSKRHRSTPVNFAIMKKKEKISPTLSTSKSQVWTCGVNFGKIKIFVFMVLKAHIRTCELCGHAKKKKYIYIYFPNSIDIEVTGPELWHQFRENQSFCFYGPKGTGPDL